MRCFLDVLFLPCSDPLIDQVGPGKSAVPPPLPLSIVGLEMAAAFQLQQPPARFMPERIQNRAGYTFAEVL